MDSGIFKEIQDLIHDYISNNCPGTSDELYHSLLIQLAQKLDQLFWILVIENSGPEFHGKIENILQKEGKDSAMNFAINNIPNILSIWRKESIELLAKHSNDVKRYARNQLIQVFKNYDKSYCRDEAGCRKILESMCPSLSFEIMLLTEAISQNIPSDLLPLTDGTPIEPTVSNLIQRLKQKSKLNQDTAKWVVESWAIALGVHI